MNGLLFLFSSFFVVSLFVLLCYFISFSFFHFYGSVSSPFECGFNPMLGSTVFFSIPFFLITVMFLLFDVEILILCFYPMFISLGGQVSFYTLVVILIVLFSTLYEWGVGVIGWM